MAQQKHLRDERTVTDLTKLRDALIHLRSNLDFMCTGNAWMRQRARDEVATVIEGIVARLDALEYDAARAGIHICESEKRESMTLDEFQKLFPNVPFALHYVERGGPNRTDRKFGWHASFTSSYWTSDTDRPIYNHHPPRDDTHRFCEGWGETMGEALGSLAVQVFRGAERRVEAFKKELELAETRLRDLSRKLDDNDH